MLRKALNSEQVYSSTHGCTKLFGTLLGGLTYLCTLLLSMQPANAFNTWLAVVKSQDNVSQWAEISSRLDTLGLNYCVMDWSKLGISSDLNNIKILFLPNVVNIDGVQAEILEQWMKGGGRVIVTGPTGTMSQPEIRTQLRSLFGAYWGFSNSSPSTLKLLDNQQQKNTFDKKLSSTLMGGVVIPTNANSQTAAVWLSQGNPPAVVVTDKSTFLGWRWGVDKVASAALDTAWLEAALGRYGLTVKNQLLPTDLAKGIPCNTNQPNTLPNRPVLPTLRQNSAVPSPVAKNPQNKSLNWTNEPPGTGALSAEQIQSMSQELQNLIARFESTLLAAEATNSGNNGFRPKLIAEYPANSANHGTNPAINRSYQAITEAKQGLQNFLQLVNQQNYVQAREQWLKARRTLWDNYPTDRQFAQPEVRAMWLDRGTIVQAKSEKDLAKIFDRMAQAGINTVFFETINAGYTIYPSQVAPEQNPLTVGWDPLKSAVKLAHERGMELHAWAWIFAAANQRHNLILNQPLEYLGPVLSRHPDWAITDKSGSPFDYSLQYKKAFLDPANPEVQRYLLSLLEEIAMNYAVDGIQFDYIRYPFQDPKTNQTFGYSQSSRWLFKEMTGVDPLEIFPGHPLWNQWTGFRIRQVDSFVATASARLKSRRPELVISAAVFPISQRDRLFRLQQNWEEWGRNNWVDMIVLMTYALDTGNLEDMTRPLFEDAVAGSALVIPGLRLLKVPDPVTVDQVQYIRNMPTGGYALFAAENLTPELETIFNRTQGSVKPKSPEPLPYRRPFQATASRFQSLQQEWNFLLVNNQLKMERASLMEWSKQVDLVGATLKRLAENPTKANLNTARTDLTRFRRQFNNWMLQQKTVQPYQVEVWLNRLDTLDRLLSYGESLMFTQRRTTMIKIIK